MSFALFRVGKTWHYRFQVNGVRIQKSTHEKFRWRAESVAQKAYEDARLISRGGDPTPTLDQLFTDWLAIHSAVASSAHIKSVDTVQRLHMYDLADRPLDSITTELIELARNAHLVDHAPSSVNHWLRVINLVGNWAVKRGIIDRLPWRVRMIKVQKRPRRMLPISAAKDWLAAVDKYARHLPALGTAVRLMFGLGLRESEAAGARWEWMDWDRCTYTPGKTKGREAEPLPIPPWLVSHLAPLRRTSGIIAANSDGTQFASGFARKVMEYANDRCNLDGLTPHRLRGTFATLLSEEGVPIQTIQKVMRHKSPLTTMTYLETNMDVAANAQQDIASKIGL